jgi:magnesium-transporting ATPase (P-type)
LEVEIIGYSQRDRIFIKEMDNSNLHTTEDKEEEKNHDEDASFTPPAFHDPGNNNNNASTETDGKKVDETTTHGKSDGKKEEGAPTGTQPAVVPLAAINKPDPIAIPPQSEKKGPAPAMSEKYHDPLIGMSVKKANSDKAHSAIHSEVHSPTDNAKVGPAMTDAEKAHERQGLTTVEAEHLYETVGFNELPYVEVSLFWMFFAQFTGVMPFMLELACVLALAVQSWIDFAIIAAILICNGVLGFMEELKAKQSLVKKASLPFI